MALIADTIDYDFAPSAMTFFRTAAWRFLPETRFITWLRTAGSNPATCTIVQCYLCLSFLCGFEAVKEAIFSCSSFQPL